MRRFQPHTATAFILHYGAENRFYRVIVDGGPAGTFRKFLWPRLRELKKPGAPVELSLVLASSGADERLRGLVDMLDMTPSMLEEGQSGDPVVRVAEIWHNRADQLMGAQYPVRSADGTFLEPRPSRPNAEQIYLGSIPLGRQLRSAADRLGLPYNPGFEEGIVASQPMKGIRDFDGGLRITVLGPHLDYIYDQRANLKRRWSEDPTREPSTIGEMGTFSSIYVLASMGDKNILFTGDAQGHHVLAGLYAHGLVQKGRSHVDVLIVPQHGSSNTVGADFFAAVTADHYVISGNGRDNKPDLAFIQMILSARRDAEYDIHFSHRPEEFVEGYPVDDLRDLLFESKKEGGRFRVHAPFSQKVRTGIALHDRCDNLALIDQHSPESLWSPLAGTRIFLSYHRRETSIASTIRDLLQDQGLKVWMADEELTPGTPAWMASVERALDSSQFVVAVLSPGAKRSEWVRRELYYADIRQLRVIPVVVAGSPEDSVPIELSHLQRVVVADEQQVEEGVSRIISALERCRRMQSGGAA